MATATGATLDQAGCVRTSASASHNPYSRREAEAGSPSKSVTATPSIGAILLTSSNFFFASVSNRSRVARLSSPMWSFNIAPKWEISLWMKMGSSITAPPPVSRWGEESCLLVIVRDGLGGVYARNIPTASERHPAAAFPFRESGGSWCGGGAGGFFIMMKPESARFAVRAIGNHFRHEAVGIVRAPLDLEQQCVGHPGAK
jgi:hypothetical protein